VLTSGGDCAGLKTAIRAGGVSAKRGWFATWTIRARSCPVSAWAGVGRSASGRRSPFAKPSPVRQRWKVRTSMPASAQADARRAPPARACWILSIGSGDLPGGSCVRAFVEARHQAARVASSIAAVAITASSRAVAVQRLAAPRLLPDALTSVYARQRSSVPALMPIFADSRATLQWQQTRHHIVLKTSDHTDHAIGKKITPLCQRSWRPDRIGTLGGDGSRTWLSGNVVDAYQNPIRTYVVRKRTGE
jgi:hypothetical protein